MDTKKLNVDIPRLEGDVPLPQKKKFGILHIISRTVMIIFIITSLILHTAIIANAFDFFKNEGYHILFSNIFPKYEKSEPMIPTLPEGNTVEDKKEDKDAPSSFPIRVCDLSANAEYGLALTNETMYEPDLYELLGGPLQNDLSSDTTPKVLIYHSHATESFCHTEGTSFRTSDTESNMVAIGRTIRTVLESLGIEVIHLTELFDEDDWSASYDKSNAAVREALREHPDIGYVLDVHRDCIGNHDDGYVSATTEIYNKNVAQLMLVCGTDEGGSGHTDWRDNLTFAATLQASIHNDHPDLMRPINLRRASFYQDSSPRALILECGTCANTLTEAKRGAVLFSCSLADYILGKDGFSDPKAIMEALCP